MRWPGGLPLRGTSRGLRVGRKMPHQALHGVNARIRGLPVLDLDERALSDASSRGKAFQVDQAQGTNARACVSPGGSHEPQHTASGRHVNRIRSKEAGKVLAMRNQKPTVQAVLWQNVSALMIRHWGQENLSRLAREAKIGPGGATRLKQQTTSVGIDVLAKVAECFDVEPWHLLLPRLDPSNPPVATMTATEERLYAKLNAAFQALQSPN